MPILVGSRQPAVSDDIRNQCRELQVLAHSHPSAVCNSANAGHLPENTELLDAKDSFMMKSLTLLQRERRTRLQPGRLCRTTALQKGRTSRQRRGRLTRSPRRFALTAILREPTPRQRPCSAPLSVGPIRAEKPSAPGSCCQDRSAFQGLPSTAAAVSEPEPTA